MSDASAPPTLPGPALLYEEMEGGTRPEARITTWEKSQELRSTRFTLWDHSFELPGTHLDATVETRDSVTAGRTRHRLNLSQQASHQEKLEVYEYPGGYSHRFDGIDRQQDIDPGISEPESLRCHAGVSIRPLLRNVPGARWIDFTDSTQQVDAGRQRCVILADQFILET